MKLSNSIFITTCVCKRSVFPLYCRTVKKYFHLNKTKTENFSANLHTFVLSAGEPVRQKFWPFTNSLTIHKTMLNLHVLWLVEIFVEDQNLIAQVFRQTVVWSSVQTWYLSALGFWNIEFEKSSLMN